MPLEGAQGPNFGPRAQNLGPWAQIWAQGPNLGAPGHGPLLFQKDTFGKQGPASSPRRLSRKSCPSWLPKPSQMVRYEKLACLTFIWLGDLRICPFRDPKPFFIAKMARFRLRVFQDSDIPRTQASCTPRTVSCMPRHQLLGFQYALVAVEGCLRRFYFLKTRP